jgi:hypothetical protein
MSPPLTYISFVRYSLFRKSLVGDELRSAKTSPTMLPTKNGDWHAVVLSLSLVNRRARPTLLIKMSVEIRKHRPEFGSGVRWHAFSRGNPLPAGFLPSFHGVAPMPSDKVERIFHAIQDLEQHDLNAILRLLREYHYFEVADNRAKFERPWHDPKYGFGGLQTKLLNFLDRDAVVREQEVISHLWPDEVTLAKPHSVHLAGRDFQLGSEREWKRVRSLLAARLRQLQMATKNRLLKLELRWRIVRPMRGHLKLII